MLSNYSPHPFSVPPFTQQPSKLVSFVSNVAIVDSLIHGFLLLQAKQLRCPTTTSQRMRWNSLASKTLEAKLPWTGGSTVAWTFPELLVLLTYDMTSSPLFFVIDAFWGGSFKLESLLCLCSAFRGPLLQEKQDSAPRGTDDFCSARPQSACT